MELTRFTVPKPFNTHAHLRECLMLLVLVTLNRFYSYVVCMGNTKAFVSTNKLEANYREEILKASPQFIPIPTIMLTNHTTPLELKMAHRRGVKIVKLMPDAATTNGTVKKSVSG